MSADRERDQMRVADVSARSTTKGQWFLLRGLARESGHWTGFLEEMRSAFPDHDICALDLPGTGEFHMHSAPLSIAETALFVRQTFAQRRNPEVPAYLFAVSLGGMVVAEWLRQDPGGIAGVVLVNTSFRGYSPFYRRLWFDAYPYLVRALAEKEVEARERHVVGMVSNRPELYDQVAREWAEVYQRRPMRRETFARQLLAAARYEPSVEAPNVPVLLLNSLSDRMVHPSCSEAIAERWRCEMRRHPTAGHDLTLDAGPWVLTTVRSWLAESKLCTNDI